MQIRSDPVVQEILDAALTLAEAGSWEILRLHEVAAAAGLSLEDLRQHVREKEDLTDPWFDRADRAMLLAAPALADRSPRERLHGLLMAWLDALAPHRKVTREMILGKLEPGHLHVLAPGVLRVSRTVQWMREAAGLRDAWLRRALAETVLTAIYMATFTHWLADDSENAQRTRSLLDTLLRQAEGAALFFPGFAPPPSNRPDNA